MLATEYAQYYGIAPQGADETDAAFRGRVAGALRDMGHIIEAHEAQQNARYDENDDVMTGIMGAMAQALHGVDYGSTGEHQVGDDIAAGIYAQTPKPETNPLALLFAAMLSGH